uniref:Protein MCM10 homolog n=1 Tax=Phlebotomus papatasi TaxID=29031 RepID=A0A1B0DQW3_PHLPP
MSSLEPQIGSQNEDPELDDLEQQLLLICNEDDPTPSTSRTFDFLAEEQPEEQSPDRGKLNKILSDNRAVGVGHDSDSSDDEEIRNFLERKYNEYGRDIHMSMKRREEEKKNRVVELEVAKNMQGCDKLKLTPQLPALGRVSRVPETPGEVPKLNLPGVPKLQRIKEEMAAKKEVSVYTDPVFGMRLVKPLVSGKFLEERMKDKVSVSMFRIRNFVDNLDKSLDWVFAGVIVSKSPVKTSQNGAQYSVWTLTDLKNDIKTCTLLLFKSAHKDLWKTPQGTVVAVLNPNVMERRNDKTEANLSINTAEKVMILGQSKDLGTCRSRKKNGDPCTSIVNLSVCDHCVFHMKREFTNLSRRSELQSATAGRGLNELRNKVLGKNEVFYGGQSFTAIPAKKNAKQVAKDNQRLLSLSEYFGRTASSSSAGNPGQARQEKVRRAEAVAEVNVAQRQKDLERLRILRAESSCGSGPGSVGNPGNDSCAIPGQKLQEKPGRAANLGELNSAQKPKNPDQGKLPKDDSSISGSSLNPQRPVLTNPCDNPGQKIQEKSEKAATLNELNSAQKPKNPDQGKLPKAESSISGNTLASQPSTSGISSVNPTPKLQEKSGKPAVLTEKNLAQKQKDLDRLSVSRAESSSSGSSPTQSTSTSSGNPPETSSGNPQMAIFSSMTPTLSRSSFVVDVESKATLKARAKAAEILKKTPLQKSNPNFIKYRGTESGKKRVLEEMNQELPKAKRQKIEEQAKKDRIQKIMAATTSHMDLVDRREMQETQKYLNTLEKKEALEEKMLSTYKVACKAVACKKCKYLAFSAAPRCLEERHPLKVIDTEKRFFKCGDCGNRTATVHRIPKFSCKNCSSSRWEPTGMIRERIVESTGDKLSIRGDEEKYLGTTTAGNINLLVPDDQLFVIPLILGGLAAVIST